MVKYKCKNIIKNWCILIYTDVKKPMRKSNFPVENVGYVYDKLQKNKKHKWSIYLHVNW